MDTTYLIIHLDDFLSHMQLHCFSKNIIAACESSAKFVLKSKQSGSWNSFDDMLAEYRQHNSYQNVSYVKHRSLKLVYLFATKHEYPIPQLSQTQLALAIHSKGKLDLYPLQCEMEEFIHLLSKEGYRVGKRSTIRTVIGRTIILGRVYEWNSFHDIIAWYDTQSLSESYKAFVKNVIAKMESFMITGKVLEHPSIKKKLETQKPSLGKLDLTYLQAHLPELLDYMVENGYGPDYRKKVSYLANRIIVKSRTIAWDSYEDIWNWYGSNAKGEKYLQDVRCVLGLLKDFHIKGIMPNNHATQNSLCLRDNNYSHLCTEYKELIDYVNNSESERGLKQSSIYRTKVEASSFFRHLQEHNVYSLKDITEDIVLDFFYSDGEEKRGYAMLASLRRFLTKCLEVESECKQILLYLPDMVKSRKTIQYLTSEEIDLFKKAIYNYDNNLSYKDRAVGGLLVYTPMRCSDITNLTLDSFDLKNLIIEFNQKKTNEPVKLTMNINLGNLIYDYCIYERADVESKALFLTTLPPYNPLGEGGIAWAASKVMCAAGIRQKDGDRKGTHIFRHRAAATMAQSNIPSPVITKTMGQKNPQSLDPYLNADIVHLRICALGLQDFPIPKEVFFL